MRLPALVAALLFTASPPDAAKVRPVDPLGVQDDDFARHRDPAEWRGLNVSAVEFREERARWRLWRIANAEHPRGPLFFVPHDNENAGFEAGLVAVRKYGGVLIAIDSGISPGDDGKRLNNAVDYGRSTPIAISTPHSPAMRATSWPTLRMAPGRSSRSTPMPRASKRRAPAATRGIRRAAGSSRSAIATTR